MSHQPKHQNTCFFFFIGKNFTLAAAVLASIFCIIQQRFRKQIMYRGTFFEIHLPPLVHVYSVIPAMTWLTHGSDLKCVTFSLTQNYHLRSLVYNLLIVLLDDSNVLPEIAYIITTSQTFLNGRWMKATERSVERYLNIQTLSETVCFLCTL